MRIAPDIPHAGRPNHAGALQQMATRLGDYIFVRLRRMVSGDAARAWRAVRRPLSTADMKVIDDPSVGAYALPGHLAPCGYREDDAAIRQRLHRRKDGEFFRQVAHANIRLGTTSLDTRSSARGWRSKPSAGLLSVGLVSWGRLLSRRWGCLAAESADPQAGGDLDVGEVSEAMSLIQRAGRPVVPSGGYHGDLRRWQRRDESAAQAAAEHRRVDHEPLDVEHRPVPGVHRVGPPLQADQRLHQPVIRHIQRPYVAQTHHET